VNILFHQQMFAGETVKLYLH